MSDRPAYASDQPDQAESGGGVCGSCGRALPAPDLEAVAASIDQTLSLETGKMVPRTAWAGRPPDGVMDALLFFLPSVKAGRQLWERGQTLWTEQMTEALSGPCDVCRGIAGASHADAPAQTIMQGPDDAASASGATTFMPYEPQGVASPRTPAMPSTISLPAEEPDEPMTSAVPAFLDHSRPAASTSAPDEPVNDPRTTAMPTFMADFAPSGAAQPPSAQAAPPSPAPERDEHESHTIMLSALPSLRAPTRLVVIEGPVRGRQFSLGRERTTIGRSIGCHITVEADEVEYDHARVVRAGDGFQIELADTATRLFVNEEPVEGTRLLKPGDVIRIGPAKLRFESAS